MPIVPKPVTEPFDLPCPHCGASLLRVNPSGSKVPSGEYWCLDGDTVPVYARLTEAQRIMSFYTTLMVGRQSCCAIDPHPFVLPATQVASPLEASPVPELDDDIPF